MSRPWWLIPCALLGLTCGEGGGYGVDYDGTWIPVIDMHLHPGDWDAIPPETQTFLASRFPFPLNLRPDRTADQVLSATGIVGELDRGGVHVGVLFAVYAPRTVGVATNELVEAGVAEYPKRLLGFASLRVDDWASAGEGELDRLEEALAEPGMVGIKLAHAHMHFRMDDPSYFGIYELAGRLGKPVYLHTGSSSFPGIALEPAYTDPAYLEPAIAAHPQTIFILGHLGYDFVDHEIGELETCIELAHKYGNVYLEPSALGSEGADPSGENYPTILRRIREEGLVDRLIYGSDGPQSPGFVGEYLERTVTAMERAEFSADDARALLSGNFIKVFGAEAGQ
ncbi:MAG: amidohydrolase [Myxococcales bacterium]|nr:amidohydrolase [Myxococcales bacterium]